MQALTAYVRIRRHLVARLGSEEGSFTLATRDQHG